MSVWGGQMIQIIRCGMERLVTMWGGQPGLGRYILVLRDLRRVRRARYDWGSANIW